MRHRLNRVFLFVFMLTVAAGTVQAETITHGSTTINMDFVSIGNAGNAADTQVMYDGTTDYGSVGYSYNIGKYEVTANQWAAVIAADSTVGNAGSWTGSQPTAGTSWYEAAKFCNWLTSGSAATGVYTFTGAITSPAGVTINRNYRNAAGVAYFIPTEDEWYKAAYYDGAKNVYYDYPIGSDGFPDLIDFDGDTEFDAVSSNYYSTEQHPNEVSNSGVASSYGTFAQGGNVWEWNETLVSGSSRGLRGGSYGSGLYVTLASSFRNNYDGPTSERGDVGFRVASVPEPGSLIMLAGIAVTGLLYWWRKTVQCEHWNSAQGIRSESSGQSFLSGLSKGTFIGVSRRERLVKSIFSGLLILGVMQLVLTGSPNFAGGEVLLDTMQGDQFTNQTTSAYYIHNPSIEDKRVAVRFTIPDDGDYRLSPVELLVAARFSTTEELAVTLYKDAPTFPGAILDAVTLTNLPLSPDGAGELTLPITSVAFEHAPDLLAGESYYVALSAPTVGDWTDVYWFTNRNNLQGPLAILSSPLNGTDWQVSENASLPRLTVQAVRVPEPGSFAMLAGIALTALLYGVRKHV